MCYREAGIIPYGRSEVFPQQQSQYRKDLGDVQMIYLEILDRLATGGMTVQMVAEGLQAKHSSEMVKNRLLAMERERLVMRVRARDGDRWWPNKQALARIGAELCQRAEKLPDVPHEDMVRQTQKQVLNEQITVLLRHPLRIEILKTLESASGIATELFRRLPSRPSRNAAYFSLQQLEKFELVASERIFIRTFLGGYYAKRYNLTALGLKLSQELMEGGPKTEGGGGEALLQVIGL